MAKSISKLKDQARSHEQNEEWEKAAQLYQQVLRTAEQEGDIAAELGLFNRVGDIYLRLGRPQDAVTFFEQAADHYAADGLFNNAIALCNKALRHVPNRLELYRKLGRLSANQGFATDARRFFLEYAERNLKAGALDEAFTALRELADLTDDPEVRELLARQLHAHSKSKEAVAELRRAYASRVRAGDRAGAEAVRDQVAAIDRAAAGTLEEEIEEAPSDEGPLAGLPLLEEPDYGPEPTETAVVPPEIERPAPPLPPLPLPEPIDEERAANQAAMDAERAAAEAEIQAAIAAADAAVAEAEKAERAAQNVRDERAAAAARLAGFDPTLLGDVSASVITPGLERPEEVPPEGLAPLPLMDFQSGVLGVGAEGPPPIPLPLLGLEEEATAAPIPGLELPPIMLDETALRGMGVVPEEQIPPALEGQAAFPAAEEAPPQPAPPFAPNTPAAQAPPLIPFDEAEGTLAPDRTGLPPLEQEPPLPELRVEKPTAAAPPAPAERPSLRDLILEELPVEDQPPAKRRPEEVSLRDLILEQPATEERKPPKAEPEEVSLRDLLLDEPTKEEPPAPPPAEAEPWAAPAEAEPWAAPAQAEPWATTPAKARRRTPQPPAAEPAAAPPVPAETGDPVVLLARSLYAHGQPAAGRAALDQLLAGAERAGDSPRVLEVLEALADVEPDDVDMHQRRVELCFSVKGPRAAVAALLGLAGALEHSGEGRRASAVYQQVLDIDPSNATAGAALRRERAARPRKEDQGGFVDLGAMLLSEEAPPEATTRFVVTETAPTGDEEKDFVDMLEQFKVKVAEHMGEDPVAHYDLGLAYKEMGLLDEAVAEFQIALRNGQDRLKVLEELGRCFMLKEEPRIALRLLGQALAVPGHEDVEYMGVNYLLGRCYEAVGEHDAARDAYERVVGVDIQFNDVAERLARL